VYGPTMKRFVPDPPVVASDRQLREWVRSLGAARFADRQEAVRGLRAAGELALPALRAARHGEDPEGARQAHRLAADLLARARSDAPESRMLPLALVLGRVDPDRAFDDGMRLLADQRPSRQFRGITLLGCVGNELAVDALFAVLRDEYLAGAA